MSIQPIQRSERNNLIDVLRGFALLGVLMANLTAFVVFALSEDMARALITTTGDKVTEIFVTIFVENKFITLFSLLFGYGFGVIIDRVEAKGIAVNTFFVRRMIVLLLLGIIHLGIWWGEILSTYALCGLLLLLFRKANDKTLLITAVVLLFVVCPALQVLRLTTWKEDDLVSTLMLKEYFDAIISGNWPRIISANYNAAWHFLGSTGIQLRDMAEILAKFLFGYYVLRKGFLSLPLNLALIKRAWIVALAIASLYVLRVSSFMFYDIHVTGIAQKLLLFVFDRLGILSLSVFYALSVARWYHAHQSAKVFDAFRTVGTMSLTNYLTHTIFYIFIYYGTGLGLLGVMHLQWTIPLALGIYSFQVIVSKWWLRSMKYGPVEWLWRQAAYGQRLPLRIVRR